MNVEFVIRTICCTPTWVAIGVRIGIRDGILQSKLALMEGEAENLDSKVGLRKAG